VQAKILAILDRTSSGQQFQIVSEMDVPPQTIIEYTQTVQTGYYIQVAPKVIHYQIIKNSYSQS